MRTNNTPCILYNKWKQSLLSVSSVSPSLALTSNNLGDKRAWLEEISHLRFTYLAFLAIFSLFWSLYNQHLHMSQSRSFLSLKTRLMIFSSPHHLFVAEKKNSFVCFISEKLAMVSGKPAITDGKKHERETEGKCPGNRGHNYSLFSLGVPTYLCTCIYNLNN